MELGWNWRDRWRWRTLLKIDSRGRKARLLILEESRLTTRIASLQRLLKARLHRPLLLEARRLPHEVGLLETRLLLELLLWRLGELLRILLLELLRILLKLLVSGWVPRLKGVLVAGLLSPRHGESRRESWVTVAVNSCDDISCGGHVMTVWFSNLCTKQNIAVQLREIAVLARDKSFENFGGGGLSMLFIMFEFQAFSHTVEYHRPWEDHY